MNEYLSDPATINELHKLSEKHPELCGDGVALALKYLENQGEHDIVDDILRGRGRVPAGCMSRKARIEWMRGSNRPELVTMANIIDPYRLPSSTNQYWLARWVKLYVDRGMTPDQAAWKVSKESSAKAPIQDGEARQAYRREFESGQ